MQILIRSARIIDSSSPHNKAVKDILIQSGKIIQIGKSLKPKGKFKEVNIKNCHVSTGWFDIGAHLCDPGFEHKEDFTSGLKAAQAGGYTGLAVMPNTQPALHSKSEIEYVVNKANQSAVDVYPIGSLTKNCEGADITEMYDMHNAGAIAFSDGLNAIDDAGILLRSLQYVKPFDGLIINQPSDKGLTGEAMINESAISAQLGIKGIPSLAEEIAVARDIELLKYADSRLHLAQLSSKKSVQLVKAAQSKGLQLSCGVSAYHLALTDEEIVNFDSNYKVFPPLRQNTDREALIKGLKAGTIQVICSGHIPQDEESKKMEFEYAEYGVINLQTAFAIANEQLSNILDLDALVEKFTTNPRKILNLPQVSVNKNQVANLTLFDPDLNWTFDKSNNASKSNNSPFLGKQLVGKALGTVNKGILTLN